MTELRRYPFTFANQKHYVIVFDAGSQLKIAGFDSSQSQVSPTYIIDKIEAEQWQHNSQIDPIQPAIKAIEDFIKENKTPNPSI
jgi:hypothetical protein